MNRLRLIRERTGLNRSEFALKVGKSLESLRNYERGHIPPREVMERVQQLWPEIFTAVASIRSEDPPTPEEAEWIAILLDILRSGSEEIIVALQHNMKVFHRFSKGGSVEVIPGVRVRHPIKVGSTLNANRRGTKGT